MGQCGCGDFRSDGAYRVGNAVVSVDLYPGCDGCDSDPAVSLAFFDEKGEKSWLEGAEPVAVVPDEYGGNNGAGHYLELFTIKDLADVIRGAVVELDDAALADDFADAMESFGRHWMMEAFIAARKRRREKA